MKVKKIKKQPLLPYVILAQYKNWTVNKDKKILPLM